MTLGAVSGSALDSRVTKLVESPTQEVHYIDVPPIINHHSKIRRRWHLVALRGFTSTQYYRDNLFTKGYCKEVIANAMLHLPRLHIKSHEEVGTLYDLRVLLCGAT